MARRDVSATATLLNGTQASTEWHAYVNRVALIRQHSGTQASTEWHAGVNRVARRRQQSGMQASTEWHEGVNRVAHMRPQSNDRGWNFTYAAGTSEPISSGHWPSPRIRFQPLPVCHHNGFTEENIREEGPWRMMFADDVLLCARVKVVQCWEALEK